MIALNHSFVGRVAQGDVQAAVAATLLVEHVRRRTGALPLVHHTLATFDTGRGPLVAWANTARADVRQRPLVELLLRTLSGPFVYGRRFGGDVAPSLAALPGWLEEVVRILIGDGAIAREVVGLVSPWPTGGADADRFVGGGRAASNWLRDADVDRDLAERPSGRGALDVLIAAEREMGGQLVVLPSARRSAGDWELDCSAAELHRALLGLEVYVSAMAAGLPREQCAERYYQYTTIPMSQESAATGRSPTRRRQRLFMAGQHGQQYFDMHAKPGNLTRVHVWVPPIGAQGGRTPIYVGHCGRHLD